MSAPSIALVALSRPSLPDADAVAAELGRLIAAAPAPRVTSRTDAAFTLAFEGGATANVTLVDKPIPWERIEGPCATAWYWPEAEAAMRPHTAHLFVTLLDESKRLIDVSFRLTRVLVATAANAPAVGLVWGASGAVHEPQAFAELAAQSSDSDLPLNLWIDFRVYQQDAGVGYGFFTTGMEALGRRELEVPHYDGEPQHLVAAAYNIAHYILEKDAAIKDAEVIGLPDESQVTIREDRSMIDPEQDVVRLEFN
ncbi:DUF4261 domain-containing protein [Botrimarina mediterranea]|uniref:DUF4261 domain-containing protein n=1 Tax=Botrimarina mediterranea TaxID=2528022 RepID=A0A518KBW2_9BACT|nr:DUF4261 domain-containing protein [Botrimarina mediterranea]QDV75265.1 hypothetical protein Spa11_34790 [Botrimarina mediterranea]QDV79934.1 hypothetical protein K2D_35540 [Planctomycetes bacterium K2D]